MNLKSLLPIVTAMGLLAACVQEDLIVPLDPGQREDMEISLILQMAGIEAATKALGDENDPYRYATTEELKVTHCVVAVFDLSPDGKPGKLLGCRRVEKTALEPATVNDSLAYRISHIPAKTGDVRVLVIANSTLDYSAFTSYVDFEKAVEKTQFSSTFDPTHLVKCGYKDVTIDKNTIGGDITVAMTQLAARVDLTFTMSIPDGGVTEQMTYLHEEKVNQMGAASTTYEFWSTGSLCYSSKKCFEHNLSGTCYFNPVKQQTDTYQGERPMCEIEGVIADVITDTERWALRVKSITVNNIQTQTSVIPGAVNLLPLEALSPPWKQTPGKLVEDKYTLTFYTYGKKLYDYDTDPDALTIQVDVDLVKGVWQKSRRCTLFMHVIWICRDNGEVFTARSGDEERERVFVPLTREVIDGSAQSVETFLVGPASPSFPKSYTLNINPTKSMPGCHTDGLIHGNLYDINLVFKSAIFNASPDVQYRVVDWKQQTKQIPPFGQR